MACLIRLDRRPLQGQYCVSVHGISPTTDPAKLERCFRECGGPLENLIVHESQFGESASQFATAQFFCEADCERCIQNCDGILLHGRLLHVTRLTRTLGWSSNGAILELPAAKAIELMNHFVGFNGWSSELLGMEPISRHIAPGGAAVGSLAAGQLAAAGFEARVCVRIPRSAIEVVGTGVGDVGGTVAGTTGFEVTARRKKTAVTNAMKNALARLIIILFPSGKVVVRAVERDAETAEPELVD